MEFLLIAKVSQRVMVKGLKPTKSLPGQPLVIMFSLSARGLLRGSVRYIFPRLGNLKCRLARSAVADVPSKTVGLYANTSHSCPKEPHHSHHLGHA